MKTYKRFWLVALVFGFAASAAYTQAIPVIKAFSGDEAVSFFGQYCSSCHDWAGSYQTISEASRIRPGNPTASPAFVAMDSGRMPPGDPRPTRAE
ncbi:MAG: hypothetical protein E4H20_09820, partial [Spirochaetales bacterium]